MLARLPTPPTGILHPGQHQDDHAWTFSVRLSARGEPPPALESDDPDNEAHTNRSAVETGKASPEAKTTGLLH
jgi:hypothetical protein